MWMTTFNQYVDDPTHDFIYHPTSFFCPLPPYNPRFRKKLIPIFSPSPIVLQALLYYSCC